MRNLMYSAAVLLSAAFAPAAFAGCGKSTFTHLAVTHPGARAASLATRPDASVDSPGKIVGLWLNMVSIGGQEIFQAFESFSSDGLEVLNDNGSPLEGNVCLGVWSVNPRKVILVNHPAWSYDSNGNLIGTVVIREQITVDPGGNTFTGTVTVDTYDLMGNVAAPEFQADLAGKRITP